MAFTCTVLALLREHNATLMQAQSALWALDDDREPLFLGAELSGSDSCLRLIPTLLTLAGHSGPERKMWKPPQPSTGESTCKSFFFLPTLGLPTCGPPLSMWKHFAAEQCEVPGHLSEYACLSKPEAVSLPAGGWMFQGSFSGAGLTGAGDTSQ